MNSFDIHHGHFVIEREFAKPPSRVFAAWADINQKARWFIGPETWSLVNRTLDFVAGGEEILHGRFENGMETYFKARYHQITENQRIVYVYDMHSNGKFHSVSLATVEFIPSGTGTKMKFSEQVSFLDGTPADKGIASRQCGTSTHFDRLDKC